MTTQEGIEKVLSRGVAEIYPSPEALKERLETGEKLRFYLGIDPTGPTLHLGHLIPLIKLRQLQDIGHEIILLIGDLTATIGDPDKLSVREPLTREQVVANAQLYQEQAARILRFDGDNPAQLKYNTQWLAEMSFADVLELASHMTVQQMLERDMFERRMKEGLPVYIHEFLYPLMQGYDSVAMDVDGEVGATDQIFNMLAGRTLLKQYRGKEKFVIAMNILADNEGVKMGKTTGNMVALTDSARDMFGKVMSFSDALILPAFELCTLVSDEELSDIAVELSTGTNPRDLKMRLAQEIVTLLLGEDAAESATAEWEETFQKGGVPEEIPTVEVHKDAELVGALLLAELVPSKSEFRRLIEQKGIKQMIEGGERVVEDVNETIVTSAIYKIGKHRFIHVRVK